MAGKIRLIGAVGIKVRPDTTEFKRELREQIKNLPDYDIEVNVDADTTIMKRKLQKAKEEAERDSITLNIDDNVYDDLKRAQAQIKRAIADLSKEEIKVGLNADELNAKLENLKRKARGAKLTMEINEDKAGYESALAKIRQIQREKMVKEITFKTDNKTLAAEARKYEKLLADLPEPVKTITITHRNDNASLTKAIAQIDEELAKLTEVKIEAKLSWAELKAQKKLLEKELAAKPLIMKVNEDKAGYEGVLKKILDLQAQAKAVEFKFKTDPASLEAAAAEVRAKIKALTPDATFKIKYDNNTASLTKALAEVNAMLDETRKMEITATLDKKGILAAKADLEKALANSEFQVKVDSSSMQDLEAEQKRIADLLDGFREKDVVFQVRNTKESLEEAKKQLDDLAKKRQAEIKAQALTGEAAWQLAYASRARDVPFYVRINQKSLAVAEGVLQSLAGINVLRESGQFLENIVTKFDQISLKAGAISTAVGSVADTILYLGTALFPVAEGMLNVVGLLAMAPAALAAVTAGVLINVAAWKNFKGAVDGNAKAMASLPPEAQKTAKALQGVWDKMQDPIQNSFWKGMGDSMATSFQKFIPVVQDGLTQAAEHVGRFGAGVFKSFEKLAVSGDLQKMFNGLSGMFDNAAGAAEPLFDAINRIGLRGSEYLPRFGEWLTELTTRFDNWVKKADEAGRINDWIVEGVNSLKDMWTLGGGVIKMLQGITEAAKTAGAGGLHDVAVRFSEIGDMMKDEPFQSRLSTIFDGARAGASALNVGVKDLGRTFGDSSLFVANMLSLMGKLGGGILTDVATAMGNIRLQTGLIDSMQGMNRLVGDLRTGFYDVGTVVGNLGSIAGAAFGSIGPVINGVIQMLAGVTTSLGPELMAMIPNLMGLVSGLVASLSGPVQLMADTLAAVLSWVNSLPGPMASLVTGFAAFVLLAGKIGPMFAAKPGGFLERIKYDFQQADGAREKFSVGVKGIGAGLLGAVGGPWGLAIGLATTGLGMMGQAAQESKDRIDAYTASLDENTGALTKNSFANAAKNLTDKGGWWEDVTRGAQKAQDVIKGLGLSFEDTASTAARGGPQYDDLMNKLKQYPGVTGESGKSMKGFADAMGISEDQASKYSRGDIQHVISRLQEVNTETATGKTNWDNLNDSVGRTTMTDAQRKVEDFNVAMRAYNDTTATADTRTRALDTALRILRGEKVDLTQATRQANDSTRAMAGSTTELEGVVKTTGGAFRDANGNVRNFKGVIDETTGVIDTQTEAGSNLSKMLEQATHDTKTVATQMKDAHKPIGEVATYLDKQREAFVQLGVQAGLDEGVVRKAYDNMIGANPGTLLTTIMTEGVEDAQTKLRDYKGSIEAVDGYKAVAHIMGENVVLGVALADSYGKMSEFDKVIATATIGLDPTQADAVRQRVLMDLVNLAATNPTVLANMDPALLDEAKKRIDGELQELGRQKPSPEVDMKVEEAQARLGKVMDLINTVHGQKPSPVVDAQTGPAEDKLRTTTDKLNEFGRQRPNAVVTADTSQSNQAMDILNGKLEPFKGKLYSFQVKANTDSESLQLLKSLGAHSANGSILNGLGMPMHGFAPEYKFANGGFFSGRPVKQFANGGVENHVAQIARGATPYRVWAEPETGGEAYIPLSQAKRGRSTQILEQVAKQFGYGLTKTQVFADGGVVNGGNARATGGLNVHIDTFNQNAQDTIEDVGRGIMRQVRNAGMAGIMDGI